MVWRSMFKKSIGLIDFLFIYYGTRRREWIEHASSIEFKKGQLKKHMR